MPQFEEHPYVKSTWSWRPARELGGDFIDALPHPKGGVVHASGDVSGKGSAAALYGALAQGLLRSEFLKQPSCPGDVMEDLNTALYRCLPANRFVAMTLTCFDPGTMTLRYVNAGMPHPLVIRQQSVSWLTATALPLGMLPETRYPVASQVLSPGDIVLFASDGLTENHDLAAIFTHMARRGTRLTLETCQERLRQLERCETEISDDQTFVLWEVTG